jgi:hypothetical protein
METCNSAATVGGSIGGFFGGALLLHFVVYFYRRMKAQRESANRVVVSADPSPLTGGGPPAPGTVNAQPVVVSPLNNFGPPYAASKQETVLYSQDAMYPTQTNMQQPGYVLYSGQPSSAPLMVPFQPPPSAYYASPIVANAPMMQPQGSPVYVGTYAGQAQQQQQPIYYYSSQGDRALV